MTRAKRTPDCLSVVCVAAIGMATLAPLSMSGCGTTPERRQPEGAAELQRDRARAMELARQADRAEASGNSERATELYQESIRASDSIPAVWNNLGTLMMEAENYAGAVQAFQRAAELDLTDNRPLENVALAYSRVGWSQQSLSYYERALNINPSSLTALRGSVYEAQRLGQADHTTRDRIREAMLIETDPQWRAYFERQRFRVEAGMRSNGR